MQGNNPIQNVENQATKCLSNDYKQKYFFRKYGLCNKNGRICTYNYPYIMKCISDPSKELSSVSRPG